MQIDLSSINPV